MQAIIRMYDGRMVDVFNLQADDVVPRNFIHSVCNLNRYTGHTPFPISVGQHILHMYSVVPQRLKRAALIHDWSEGCFNDIASPVKWHLGDYRMREKAALRVIFDAMGVDYNDLDDLKTFDVRLRQDERIATWGYDDWKADKWTYDGDAQPLGVVVSEIDWRRVRSMYTFAFQQNFPEQGKIEWLN